MDNLTCTGCGEYAGSPIADRIEELEAKLAKAVETLSLCRKMQAQFAHTEDPLMVLLDTTIAELKGQNDE